MNEGSLLSVDDLQKKIQFRKKKKNGKETNVEKRLVQLIRVSLAEEDSTVW